MAKTKVTILVCLGIAISSFLFYPLLFSEFPDNGTVEREIWFIKPTNEESPYFIFIDDVYTQNNQEVEWIQHGKDNLSINAGKHEWNFTTRDYFQEDQVKLYGKMLTDNVEFEKKMGFASVTENNEAPYLLAKVQGSQQIPTILIPLNETRTLPEIDVLKSQKNETSFRINHNSTEDIFWSRYDEQKEKITHEVDDWIPTAQSFFLRTNESDDPLSMGFKDATRLDKGAETHFLSSEPISGSLSFTEAGLDGTLSIKEPCQVELHIPEPESLLINGDLADSSEYIYEDGKLILDFEASRNYTLGDQYSNYGEMEIEEYSTPSGSEAIKKIKDKNHPYLVFDDSEIPDVLNENPPSPTEDFYQDLIDDTAEFETRIFLDGEVSFEDLERDPFKHALICWSLQVLEGEKDALKNIKKVLEKIPDYLHYTGKTLDTAQIASGAAIAYDTIYNNLTTSKQEEYAENLKTFVNPIKEAHDVIPLNNHLATDMGALGLVGLVTKDPDLVQLAINEMSNFLAAETVDGIPIESFSIATIGHHLAAPYFYAMSRLGIMDYYKKGGIIDRYYDRALDIMSPIGMFPHYEDAFDDWRPPIEFRQVAHLTENDELRKKISFFYNWQNQSSIYNLENKYFFMELFRWKDLPSPSDPSPNRTSWLSYKGGNAALRTDWDRDAVFISMNAKTYHQSHTQLDELSYEIYAYGALISMNSGFPGWKEEGHSECVSTVGSNSIRLNNQDQLQETCDGFSFHAFSKEVDIIAMDGGDLYRSPYALTQNPIFYIIIIILQISFAAIAFYYFLLLKMDKRYEETKEREDKNEAKLPTEQNNGSGGNNTLINLPSQFYTPIDDRLIYQWKVFQIITLVYFGLHFRIYAFAHSILRKLTEWSYTRDYELINAITNIVWVMLFVLPLIFTVVLYLLFWRVHKKIIATSTHQNSDIYPELKRRMSYIVIAAGIFLFLLDFAIYVREYRIMDLISKRFGTVSGFALEFVDWMLFQVGVMGLLFTFIIAVFIYKYYSLNPKESKKYSLRLLIVSLIFILLWTWLSLILHGVINSFTIETWVA
ncbi:MAG: hypothetical protein R6U96_05450 [Promethearchaeia archaeon]